MSLKMLIDERVFNWKNRSNHLQVVQHVSTQLKIRHFSLFFFKLMFPLFLRFPEKSSNYIELMLIPGIFIYVELTVKYQILTSKPHK